MDSLAVIGVFSGYPYSIPQPTRRPESPARADAAEDLRKTRSCVTEMDTVPTLKHADVLWNEEIQEWFCAKCGRTSDHTTKADALIELEQYECELPTKTQSKEVPPD